MTRRLSDKRRKKLDPGRIRLKLFESRLFEEPPKFKKFKVGNTELNVLMAYSLDAPGKKKMTTAQKRQLLDAVRNCDPRDIEVRRYLRLVSQNDWIPKRIRVEAMSRCPKINMSL